jgi:3-oxoacyl-[acyl-carrier-protein] synthase-3
MAGAEVFKKAVERMPESVYNILKKNNLTLGDVTYIIPHQANLRIISNMINQFAINPDKVIVTLDKHANCSAASIPLALAQLELTGKIKSGDILVFTAFGAGATWGAAILRW